MLSQSIFKTSFESLMERNKFFQCFVCLQQFDSAKRFPMQVCQKQHFMCFNCVQGNLFKKNFQNNQYICSLCSCKIEKKNIKKSPFLLSIKDFIQKLHNRQKIRKDKYKECLHQQSKLCEELMQQNIKQTQKISQLQKKLKSQEELLNGLLQNSNIQKEATPVSKLFLSQNISQIVAKPIFQSSIKQRKLEYQKQKQKFRSVFRSMFHQIQYMKEKIKQSEFHDQEQYYSKLQELQKHQSYVYQIIKSSSDDAESKHQNPSTQEPKIGNIKNDESYTGWGKDYPDL